jgi:hypothetical protein
LNSLKGKFYYVFVGKITGRLISGLTRNFGLETKKKTLFFVILVMKNRLCGLVVRFLGYRSGGPGSIPGTTRKKVVGLERGSLSLVSTTEELLDRKVAAPV